MRLDQELSQLQKSNVRLLHFDVMDGCFTPVMTFGPTVIKQVKTPLLKDVHLMVHEPLEKLDSYIAAGADVVSVHVESCIHVHRVFQQLSAMSNANDSSRGLVRGLALNPGTPVTVLEPLLDQVDLVTVLAVNPGWSGQSLTESTFLQVHRVKEMIRASDREILVCIDGGITKENIAVVAQLGVDIVVTGSAVFDGKAPLENANFMLSALRSNHSP
jgi:ribulose-phosphate 3-epimerase